MALPDLGIAPPDVREAATDPFRTPLEVGEGAAVLPGGYGPHGATAPHRDVTETTGIRDPAAAVVPGETQEVPVLEKPPVIGVAEAVDGLSRASTLSAHTLSTSSANPSEAW
ncbi:hypothetical protein IFM12276_49200 [Nocardia sputorum]|uniref:Uncharacterized protein n=1 Tax=Nocardia sputorum TaxID=2984338 RepID=A0ABM8D3D0_9NOCA|nr:hypothetical protein IFM12276_49200 [Nocardia sputorum]